MKVSVSIIAECIGHTERNVQNLVRAGTLPKPIAGKYDLAACMRSYIRHLEIGGARTESLAEAQRQLTLQQIRKLAMLNLERSGRVVPLDFLDQLLAGALSAIRGAAESMPARHAARFRDPQAYPLLTAAIGEVLDAAAGWLEHQLPMLLSAAQASALEHVRRVGIFGDVLEEMTNADGQTAVSTQSDLSADHVAQRAAPGSKVPRTRRTAARSKPAKRKR